MARDVMAIEMRKQRNMAARYKKHLKGLSDSVAKYLILAESEPSVERREMLGRKLSLALDEARKFGLGESISDTVKRNERQRILSERAVDLQTIAKAKA